MSKRHFLDFEHPIAELESKIDELRYVQNESAVDISEEIERLLCEVAPIRFGRLMKAAAAVENRNFTGIEGDDQ